VRFAALGLVDLVEERHDKRTSCRNEALTIRWRCVPRKAAQRQRRFRA
jgi:hypothetical protein